MFSAVLFDNINKAAFDVMKDGFSFDQKATLKTHRLGCNMSIEGKNFTSDLGGKFTIDFMPCNYFNAKKLSIENNGNAVCELDMPNILTGTTFMVRSQGNAFKQDVSKAVVGMKYLDGRISTDFNYDMITKKYNTSFVLSSGNVMLGSKLSGTQEGKYTIEGAAAYRYKGCVVSATSCDNHSAINTAIYAKPYKNVQFGATCKLSLVESVQPAIAFGMCIKPSSSSELRTKVNTDGKLDVYYKTEVSKNVFMAVTNSLEFNDLLSGTHRVGVAMEMRI